MAILKENTSIHPPLLIFTLQSKGGGNSTQNGEGANADSRGGASWDRSSGRSSGGRADNSGAGDNDRTRVAGGGLNDQSGAVARNGGVELDRGGGVAGGGRSRSRGDGSAGGGQSNSLDSVRLGHGDGAAAGRLVLRSLDREGVGVLEGDGGVGLITEDKTVELQVTERSVDVPRVGLSTVLDTSCCFHVSTYSYSRSIWSS